MPLPVLDVEEANLAYVMTRCGSSEERSRAYPLFLRFDALRKATHGRMEFRLPNIPSHDECDTYDDYPVCPTGCGHIMDWTFEDRVWICCHDSGMVVVRGVG